MANKSTFAPSALTDILECKLCKNPLKQPHTLQQCLHSFCKLCTDAIPKKENEGKLGWFCPMCTDFTKEGEMKENLFLIDLQRCHSDESNEKKEEKIVCKQCQEKGKAADWKCHDCKIQLCEECKVSHLNIPMLKDHVIRAINLESNEGNVIDKLVFCKLHENKAMEFNCKICEKLICTKCTSSEHSDHTIESVVIALERLVPEMEINSKAVESHIEAQICAIMKKIDQTREAYASCRLEMDERLDKVINNLKALNMQMEEEVTEQETVALDILKHIKQKLEHKLSKAKNLVNLASVTTEKAKNQSLLDEIQSSLFKHIQNLSANKHEVLDLKIWIPDFKEGPNLHKGVNTLREIMGKVTYQDPLCTIDISTTNYKSPETGLEGDDYEDEDRDVMFTKRVTMNYLDDSGEARSQGTGELQVYLDDDVYGYRIRMKNDDAALVCNHIICRKHLLQKSEKKKFAEWTAKDFSTDEPVKRIFKVTFSSSNAVKEFVGVFRQGVQMAVESEIE